MKEQSTELKSDRQRKQGAEGGEDEENDKDNEGKKKGEARDRM